MNAAGLLLLSQLALGLDASQTMNIRRHPGQYETNVILGSHPSDLKVCAYFGGLAISNQIAYEVVPKKWRWVVPTVLLAAEVVQFNRNWQHGIRFSTPF